MEKKKALLILVGGRPMPNMLTIIHEKPDIIVAIVSLDALEEIPALEQSVQALLKGSKPQYVLDTSQIVDPFSLERVKQACKTALKTYPHADWTFNITGATKIMSIGAYEVAKEHITDNPIRCWYLDTAYTKIVSLIGEGRDEGIFNTKIKEYITACYCSLEDGDLESYRTIHEVTWLPFARYLGTSPQYALHLKEVLRNIRNINKEEHRQFDRSTEQFYTLEDLSDEAYLVLDKAQQVGILGNWHKESNKCNFVLSEPQYKFLDGTWLEVYVWDEVRKLGVFHDYEWGKKFRDRYGRKNQLDLAMIYKAQLFIVECKTGEDSFQAKTLQTMESIAAALGRGFVTKILVTSLPTNPDAESRAKSSGIFIISKDSLPNVGKKLEEQIIKPTQKRI